MANEIQVISPEQYNALVKEREQMLNYIAEIETRPLSTHNAPYIPQDAKTEWVRNAMPFETRSVTETVEYKSTSTILPWLVVIALLGMILNLIGIFK